MTDTKEILFSLSRAVGAGNLHQASEKAFDMLSEFAECEKTDTLTVIGRMRGKSDRLIMLDAHIDEISMIVTNVDNEGFVTVSNCGGIDIRMLPAQRVTIHGKREIPAVFCSTPPHLSSKDIEYDDISALKIDSMLGKHACEVIAPGDYVTFCAEPKELLGTCVTGKALDNRAGVACLIMLAQRLSKKELPCSVAFVLSDAEELGTRGAGTAAFAVHPDEAIAIDVSFGDAPDVPCEECGKLSKGAMIGYSPVLDGAISRKLTKLAKEKNIPFQNEVMGNTTGTNSDIIGISREGVRTGLISIPLRNMHTVVEVIDLKDIESVCDLLESYILAGGVSNE